MMDKNTISFQNITPYDKPKYCVLHDESEAECLHYFPNNPEHKRYISRRPRFGTSGVRDCILL